MKKIVLHKNGRVEFDGDKVSFALPRACLSSTFRPGYELIGPEVGGTETIEGRRISLTHSVDRIGVAGRQGKLAKVLVSNFSNSGIELAALPSKNYPGHPVLVSTSMIRDIFELSGKDGLPPKEGNQIAMTFTGGYYLAFSVSADDVLKKISSAKRRNAITVHRRSAELKATRE